jgi:hypothetical protein
MMEADGAELMKENGRRRRTVEKPDWMERLEEKEASEGSQRNLEELLVRL